MDESSAVESVVNASTNSIEWAVAIFIYVLAAGFLGVFAVILWKMSTDRINLEHLLSEGDGSGKASLSRFQFLLFTFVVAGVYLILCLENGQLIEIPNGVLGLLGLSGGSYVVSKGISASKKNKQPPGPPPVSNNKG